jgi:hypothetical protein
MNFAAVVAADVRWYAMLRKQGRQRVDHGSTIQPLLYSNGVARAGVLVDRREQLEQLSARRPVEQKVIRPDLSAASRGGRPIGAGGATTRRSAARWSMSEEM